MSSKDRQLPLDLAHRPALGADDFLVTPANRLAVDWLDRFPHWPGPALGIHGPAGCGKTHLLTALSGRLGQEALALESRTLSAETALTHPLAPLVVVDEYENCPDHAALFHLWNRVREEGRQRRRAGRIAPARFETPLKDLASRLAASQAIAIDAPDDALMAALLLKLFADRQVAVEPGLIDYLLSRMDRSFAAIGRLVGQLDRAALARKQAITLPLARDVLERFNLKDPSDG